MKNHVIHVKIPGLRQAGLQNEENRGEGVGGQEGGAVGVQVPIQGKGHPVPPRLQSERGYGNFPITLGSGGPVKVDVVPTPVPGRRGRVHVDVQGQAVVAGPDIGGEPRKAGHLVVPGAGAWSGRGGDGHPHTVGQLGRVGGAQCPCGVRPRPGSVFG